jgi:CIC family chloride channel protein
MSHSIASSNEPGEPRGGGLLGLALVAGLTGVAAGLLAAVFRLALEQADRWRSSEIATLHQRPLSGFLLVVGGVAVAAALACYLVQRFSPHAGGSGIPHVEAVVHGELPPVPIGFLPVKFFGGLFAMGGGLALGREGPSVQMGASIGALLGRAFGLSRADSSALLAAGAGAGLATAFNAPIAGALFVLEELLQRFERRSAIATLGASAGAILVARALLGEGPEFKFEPIPAIGLGGATLALALGAVAGLAGAAYNRALVGGLALTDRFSRLRPELRAGLIGATVGALAWFAPGWVGGGEALAQQALSGGGGVLLVSLVFLIRFPLGVVSYAAGTPGGLFAPMLALGAQIGLLFGTVCSWCFPGLAEPPAAFAVVGMAAFFTGVVRAPVTGIVLISEMTGGTTLLLQMLAACFAAMVVPTLLGNRPIYDSLKERTLRIGEALQRDEARGARNLANGL